MAVDPKGLGTYTTKEIQGDAKIQSSEVRWSTVNKGKNKNVQSILRSVQSVTTYIYKLQVLTFSDPCFVNPRSYDYVITVLRLICLQAGIHFYCRSVNREWVFEVFDALLFGMWKQVIKTYKDARFTESILLRKHLQNIIMQQMTAKKMVDFWRLISLFSGQTTDNWNEYVQNINLSILEWFLLGTLQTEGI